MARASDYKKSSFIKLLFIGTSGAGKTGALTSLVAAGYKLRIIDLDGGLDALVNHVLAECPDKIDNIEYESFRDKMKMGPTGPKVAGAPAAYRNTLQALEKWPEDGSDPATWGADTILVLDSMTSLGRAAIQWAKAMNPTSKDPRQWYKTAQDLVEDLIANITSDSFGTNVVVISHVVYAANSVGVEKGFPSIIGKALSKNIALYFNTLLLSETKGQGASVKRTIKTLPTAQIDLKNPAPMRIDAEYSVERGMAEIFTHLKKDSK